MSDKKTDGMQKGEDKSTATSKIVATTSPEEETAKVDVGIHTAVVHPLVLLSVVDHFSRVAKDTKKRCVTNC
jgi:hypothetical protein